MAGRRIWAGLHLLDHQIVDCDGRLCGNVDDLELTPGEDGSALLVTAIWSGPGALSYRMGHHTVGEWLQRMHERMADGTPQTQPIGFERVKEVDSAVLVDAPREELPDYATEKWVRDHVIGHIPGARHAAE